MYKGIKLFFNEKLVRHTCTCRKVEGTMFWLKAFSGSVTVPMNIGVFLSITFYSKHVWV